MDQSQKPLMPSFTLYIQQVNHRIHLRLAEWHLAVAMTMMGLILLSNGHTFSLAVYEVIGSYASEDVWGWVLVGVGTARLTALAVNGTIRRGAPHFRLALSVICVAIWTFLLTGYVASPIPNLMTAVVGAAVFTDLINVFRTSAAAFKENDEVRERNGSSD